MLYSHGIGETLKKVTRGPEHGKKGQRFSKNKQNIYLVPILCMLMNKGKS